MVTGLAVTGAVTLLAVLACAQLVADLVGARAARAADHDEATAVRALRPEAATRGRAGERSEHARPHGTLSRPSAPTAGGTT